METRQLLFSLQGNVFYIKLLLIIFKERKYAKEVYIRILEHAKNE